MKVAREGGLAVVTGGAGGLGSTFARQLAERGYNLLLVDRRQQPLEEVCRSITAEHGTHVEPYVADLCNRDDVEKLGKRLERMPEVEVLVNNAGFGAIDYFVDTDAKYVVDMADVHVVAPLRFTHAVLPGMMARNHGAIINVSSMAAWFQSAGNVHYGSTKCFLAVFSLSLSQELRGTNVRVQALCPGFIRTEFHDAHSMQGFHVRCAPAAHLWMTAEEVVRCSLNRLSGRQVVVIPGLGYRVLGRLAQMPVLQPLMRWITRVPRRPLSEAPAVDPVLVPPLATPAFVVADVADDGDSSLTSAAAQIVTREPATLV